MIPLVVPGISLEYIPDDRIEPYRMMGDTLVHIAEKCGVQVDDLTHARWRDAGGLMREFDTFADEQPYGDDVDPMAVFKDFSLFAPRFPELTPKALGEETFGRMVENVDMILHIGAAISKTRDTNEYIELRKAEAYYTAQAFTVLATKNVAEQEGYTEFQWRVTGLGITANLGDSILDIYGDHRKGKVSLPPSRHLYAALAYDAAKHGKEHVGHVLDKEGAQHRARMIGARALNRTKQLVRDRHIPDNSNLRVLIPSRKQHA